MKLAVIFSILTTALSVLYGTYKMEAGCSGTLKVNGPLQERILSLTINRDDGVVASYNGTLRNLTKITGGITDGSALPSSLNFTNLTTPPDLLGIWGGEHLALNVASNGATLEFDCAQGKIDSAILPDRQGRFVRHGEYVVEHGGPIRPGEVPNSHPARYRGLVKGDQMKLAVKLLDTKELIGTFLVKRDEPPHLVKCK